MRGDAMEASVEHASAVYGGGGQLNRSARAPPGPWRASSRGYAYGGVQTASGYHGGCGAGTDRPAGMAMPPPAVPFAVNFSGPQNWFPPWTFRSHQLHGISAHAIKGPGGPAAGFPAPPPPLPPGQQVYNPHPINHQNIGSYFYPSAPPYPPFQPPPPPANGPPVPYLGAFSNPPALSGPVSTYRYPPAPAVSYVPNYFHGYNGSKNNNKNNRPSPAFPRMSSPPTSPTSPTEIPVTIHWQQELEKECDRRNIARPVYSLHSDRRGGRTAWSCKVLVRGESFPARYWYSGHHNAHEDAAEVALKWLQQSSPSTKTTSTHGQYIASSPPGSSYVLSTSSGPSSSAAAHPVRHHHPAQHHYGHYQMQYATAGSRGDEGGDVFYVKY